jgi:hypothetical protein
MLPGSHRALHVPQLSIGMYPNTESRNERLARHAGLELALSQASRIPACRLDGQVKPVKPGMIETDIFGSRHNRRYTLADQAKLSNFSERE